MADEKSYKDFIKQAEEILNGREETTDESLLFLRERAEMKKDEGNKSLKRLRQLKKDLDEEETRAVECQGVIRQYVHDAAEMLFRKSRSPIVVPQPSEIAAIGRNSTG